MTRNGDHLLLTRKQTAELLRRSTSWVRKLEAGGALHPVQAADGRWWHRRDEVLALAAARDGQVGDFLGASHGPALRLHHEAVPPMYQGPAPLHVPGVHGYGAGEQDGVQVHPNEHTRWRDERIGSTLANLQHGLAVGGWPSPAIEHGVAAAAHALAGLSDFELRGPAWPAWVATSAAAVVLGAPVEMPWLHSQVVDDAGGVQLVPVRPVQPGD